MEKQYDPQKIEIPIYKFWKDSGFFKPCTINNNKENYCIVMPPPNITGGLHLGHAFQQTVMDILVRFNRMQGKNTLWMTGFDHAGIATQILVENYIYKKTGKIRNDYTRQYFLQQVWEWKKRSENLISYQMQRLGNSIDWDRKCFTMDPNMSYAVTEAFIRLYNDNLIYKGKRLVNWDYKLQTAISDLEVSYRQESGFMWYIRYELAEYCPNSDFKKYIIIATTRPETIFGDVAIAVHPKDSRYSILIGKYVLIPIINRLIPIVANLHVDINKGTGCVKITPAHDFNDYIIGQEHKLLMINVFSVNRTILKMPEVFNSEGKLENKLNYYIPEIFHNLDCSKARQLVILELKKLNLFESVESHDLTILYNSRTGTVIEPFLTDQWYIRSKNLAEKAIHTVKNNVISFIPKQYKNMYLRWMDNIQDWCISRQIWWGHEIPVWYDNNNVMYVGYSEKDIRSRYQLNNNIILYKDSDVLDTWFSSSLWTFASLGWPLKKDLLNIFHPTNVIVSGFDIIFFWIARMIMMTMYLLPNNQKNVQIPFKQVYITGLVRDEFGQKMSKSKGNILDPVDIIEGISIENLLKKRTHGIKEPNKLKNIIKCTKKQFPHGIKAYGADALRITLAASVSSGSNIHWDINKLNGYHSFCNKLWNVSRFVLIHTTHEDWNILESEKFFSLSDRWILTKLNQTIYNFYKLLEDYRFDIIVHVLYEFVWRQFCDWYVEFCKSILFYEKNILKLRSTRYTLITSLEILLRLLHPLLPFITEKIWLDVKNIMKLDGTSIMLQSFPVYHDNEVYLDSINDIECIKSIIYEIRMLRYYTGISYNIPLELNFFSNFLEIKQLILENNLILIKMAHLSRIEYIKNSSICTRSIKISLNQLSLFICIPNNFDKNYAMQRFCKEIDKLTVKITCIEKKLNSYCCNTVKKDFLIREKEKLSSYNMIKSKLLNQYASIKML